MEEYSAELIIKWYLELEKKLLDIFNIIPFSNENQNIKLPIFSSIIIESGSLIDTIFRELIPANNKKNIGLKDFGNYFEDNYKFSRVRSLYYLYPPGLLSPFKKWEIKSSESIPDFWTAYTELKHNRIIKHDEFATLKNTLETVCALHQVIAKLPIFFKALLRNDMLITGQFNPEYVIHELLRNNGKFDKGIVVVETKLFVTPLCYLEFPEKIEDIRYQFFNASKKLKKFLLTYLNNV